MTKDDAMNTPDDITEDITENTQGDVSVTDEKATASDDDFQFSIVFDDADDGENDVEANSESVQEPVIDDIAIDDESDASAEISVASTPGIEDNIDADRSAAADVEATGNGSDAASSKDASSSDLGEDVSSNDSSNSSNTGNDNEHTTQEATGQGTAELADDSSRDSDTSPSTNATGTKVGEPVTAIASQLDRKLSRNDDNIFLRANPTFAFNDVTLTNRKTGRNVLDRLDLRFFNGSLYAVQIDEDAEQRAAFMAVASGLTIPTMGTVTLKSTNLAGLDGAQTRSYRIGIIPQQYALRLDLNAAANIRYAMDASGRNFLRPKDDIAQMLLEQVGYQGGSAPISEVPEVERRIAAIARAIACEPEILLADGIADGLSQEDSDRVLTLLTTIAHGGPWHFRQPYADGKHCVILVTDWGNDSPAYDHTYVLE